MVGDDRGAELERQMTVAREVASLLFARGMHGTSGVCVLAAALAVYMEAHEGSELEEIDPRVWEGMSEVTRVAFRKLRAGRERAGASVAGHG